MHSRMMEQILGLEFPGMHSQTNGHMLTAGTSVSGDGQNDYTPNLSDSLSDDSFSPEMQQWMQSYPEPSIPLHGYDFQSFA